MHNYRSFPPVKLPTIGTGKLISTEESQPPTLLLCQVLPGHLTSSPSSPGISPSLVHRRHARGDGLTLPARFPFSSVQLLLNIPPVPYSDQRSPHEERTAPRLTPTFRVWNVRNDVLQGSLSLCSRKAGTLGGTCPSLQQYHPQRLSRKFLLSGWINRTVLALRGLQRGLSHEA